MKSAWNWLRNPQLERNAVWDLGHLVFLIINYTLRETSYVPQYCCQKLLERTLFFLLGLFFPFLFISDEPAIVFVLLASATSVSIAREITFLPDNKLMSREESCNWCSRRDEIDVDLSNKEYLAPRRKEKSRREREREEKRGFIDFSARDSALPRCVLLPIRTNWFQLYLENYRALLDASLKRCSTINAAR